MFFRHMARLPHFIYRITNLLEKKVRGATGCRTPDNNINFVQQL